VVEETWEIRKTVSANFVVRLMWEHINAHNPTHRLFSVLQLRPA
jgi:hypothetical protein